MVSIAYILLCHKNPDLVIAQARMLTATGDYVAIHYDGRGTAADFARIRAALADHPNVTFAARRLKCGWGDWSLVAASLATLRAACDAFAQATHFYLLSGDCMPVKSARYMRRILQQTDADYIESHGFSDSGWIKTGLRDERVRYRHYFNERRQKWRFYAAFHVQKYLGLTRAPPADLQLMIGSQWWCLRRATISAILQFAADRPDVMRFFRTTWIPDEIFFQTLVRHLVPWDQIVNRTLTFAIFSDYGLPVVFYNDHHDLLLRQDAFFARKISLHATDLRSRLGALYVSEQTDIAIADDGQALFALLTGRGRAGRRYAARIWETGASIGPDRMLMIIACKKRATARRLGAAISAQMQIPVVGYIWDDAQTPLPDLGGIAVGLGKRNQHRRAFVRLLFDGFVSDHLVICVDPADIGVITDLCAAQATVRLLDVDCVLDAGFLADHARQTGLASPQASDAALAQLLPAIRQQIIDERAALANIDTAGMTRFTDRATVDQNTAALLGFLQTTPDVARDIAMTAHLFDDEG